MPVVVVMIQDLHLQKILWKKMGSGRLVLCGVCLKKLLTTNNIFTEEGVIDSGVSALDSKTFLSEIPGGYSIWIF